MLDTIRVKYPISPTSEQLKYWELKTISNQTGEKKTYFYNPQMDEATLRYTYYPTGYDSHPILTLEVSLPKLIFGNNYRMLASLDGAIKIGNLTLKDVPHAPILDLAEGILIRLDMCYNHQVGDTVNDYIQAIGYLDYPHRRTIYHLFEGVEFRSKHKTTKFYNKARESGCHEAYGIFRQETTLQRGKDIQKFLGKKKPTLLDVSYEQVAEYLKNDLSRLSLLGNSIATRDTALATLCEKYGKDAGVYYFGLLASKLNKSRKRIVQETDIHPRSLDRKLRKITDSGIALTLTESEEPLPPLVINYD